MAWDVKDGGAADGGRHARARVRAYAQAYAQGCADVACALRVLATHSPKLALTPTMALSNLLMLPAMEIEVADVSLYSVM